jgi:hypothetical protein
MLPSNMLLLNLILLIDVTFSTPTGDFTNYGVVSVMAIFRQLSGLRIHCWSLNIG